MQDARAARARRVARSGDVLVAAVAGSRATATGRTR